MPRAAPVARCFGVIAGFLAVALAWAFGSTAWAAPTLPSPGALPLLFDRVGDAEQIKDGVVTGLAQDRSGLLWIATTEGLVRFDGYRFRTYLADRDDPSSLPGNVVRVIHRGRDGRIWVGTEAEGVARYDPVTDGFERFGDADGVPMLPIRALAEDRDGRLWIGSTGGGLRRLDPVARRTEVWRQAPATADALPDDRISAMLVDREGDLWIGTWRGLVRRRADADHFERLLSDPGDPLGFADARIRVIAQVASGDVWVGAQQGQVAVVPHAIARSTRPPDTASVRRWRGAGPSTVAEPLPGEVWLGHPGGIDIHAADDARRLRTLRAVPGEALGLDPAEVRALMVDASGLLWVGSFGGGLQRADPRPRGLVSRRFRPGVDPPMAQFNVLTLGEDGAGGVWLGLAGVGLGRMDERLALTELLPAGTLEAGRFEGDQPAGVVVTRDGGLWVATDRGLYRRPAGGARFLRVADPAFLEGSAVRRLWADVRDGVWVGTADGLFHVDGAGGAPYRVPDPEGRPVSGSIEALAFDAAGAWVGGNLGLMRLDTGKRTLKPITTRVGTDRRTLDVNGLLVDARGTLWIDGSGLHRLVGEGDGEVELEPISARHGEEGVSFGANLLDDAQGRIWTQRAVFDPVAGRFRALLPADGAQVGTGWFRSYARLGGGRLAFGGREGVLVVTPEADREWSWSPPAVVTEVRIDGQRARLGPEARELPFPAGRRGFSIEFAALDFSAPNRNRHRYRLEGVDADWVEVPPEGRVASYGNLWPGRYRFVVQGSSRTGAWGEPAPPLEVVVAPRWWQTPLFALACFGLAAVLTAVLVRWRTASLRRARQGLEREVERRTNELRVLSEALRVRTREFEEASLTDPLTGLRNRRFMSLQMASEMALWMRRREASPGADAPRDMVVFLIDVDHFKAVNDRHGHAAGDEVLRQFAMRLGDVFRSSDHLVRWGGEEFLVVARDTSRDVAAELAERVRDAIGGTPFLADGTPVVVTASLGFAPLPWDPDHPLAFDWEAVVSLADLALYAAKQGGRDGWVGLSPKASITGDIDPARLRANLPALVAGGGIGIATNLDVDRVTALLASPAG